ncbi:MAG: hypothetical protein V8Q36_06875 [Anaerotignum sp.]
MRKEYLEELGLEDSTTANFVRGEAFHRELYRQYRLRQILWKILILAVFVLILIYWVMQYVHV